MYKKYIAIGLIAASLIPAIFLGFTIHRYAINVPFGDEWTMTKIFNDADRGKLNANDFWHQHNEHRIVFPKIFMLSIARISHWNLKVQIWFNFGLACLAILFLGIFVYKSSKQKYLAGCAVLIIAAWFFSPVQSENWLWGWQISWFLCILAVIATLLLLQGNRILNARKSFVAAILFAVIASFSLGGGLLVWPAGLLVLLIKKCRLKTYLTWIAFGLVSTIVYYIGYKKPVTSPPTAYFIHHKTETIRYFLALFGRPISDNQEAVVVIGAIILSALCLISFVIWQNRKHNLRTLSPVIAIGAFCLATASLTTISRVGFGIQQGLSSRYTAISLLLIITLIMVVVMMADKAHAKKTANAVIVGLMLFNIPLLFFSYSNGMNGMKQRSQYMAVVYQCTHEKILTDECAQETFPGFGGVVKNGLPYAKTKHWAGY